MSSRRARRRALKSEINVVPFIDVVLVLLIIFMVTAPMLQTGQVNLPDVGVAAEAKADPIQIQIDKAGQYTLSGLPASTPPPDLDALVARVAAAQQAAPNRAVVIGAEKTVQYDTVVTVMDRLQRAGVKQVGLLVRPQGK